jgi:hypothetical protein
LCNEDNSMINIDQYKQTNETMLMIVRQNIPSVQYKNIEDTVNLVFVFLNVNRQITINVRMPKIVSTTVTVKEK